MTLIDVDAPALPAVSVRDPSVAVTARQSPAPTVTPRDTALGVTFRYPPFTDRATETFTVLAVGDSITEGWSATSPANRWVQLVQDRLRASFPASGNQAAGYLPAWRNAVFAGGAAPTLVGNAVGKANAGLGYRSLALGPTAGEISWFAVVASEGTWTLTYQGDTTGPLDWDIEAEDLRTAMNALPSIGGDIVAISGVSGIFDPLFPQSNHYFATWDAANGNITPGTVNGTGLNGGAVQWLTWSNGGIAGTCTYENLDADMIQVWKRMSAFTNPIICKVDGTDVATIGTSSGAGDHDFGVDYVHLGPGTHDVEFRQDNTGGFTAQLDGIFAYKGDGPVGGYLNFPGANGWHQAPDTGPLSITGDITLIGLVQSGDYTPGTQMTVVSKWDDFSGNQRAYRLAVTTGGLIRFGWSQDGTANNFRDSTAATLTDGVDWFIAATLQASTGTVKFYKAARPAGSYDWTDATFTLISTDATFGATAIANTTAPLAVGARISVASDQWVGRIYAAWVLNGYDFAGTEVANPVYAVGRRNDPDAAGNNYGLNGAVTLDTGVLPFGIHLVEAAKGGAQSVSFARGGTGESASVTDLADWVTGLTPSLCLIALGVNDWANGVPAATFKTQMQTVIDGLRDADADLRIILVPWFEPHPAYHFFDGGDYSEYVDAQYELAYENQDVDVINFYKDPAGTGLENDANNRPADVPGGVINTASGGDGLHPSDAGSVTIADKVTPVIVDAASYGRITLGGTPERPRVRFRAWSADTEIQIGSGFVVDEFRLLEDGDRRLLENGDDRLMED